MKRSILVALVLIGFLIIAAISLVFLSFAYVKKNTDALIRIQRDKLQTIIRIPNAVPPSNPSFNSISYRWEMVTPQNETSTVNVLQTTAFQKSEDTILVILENTTGGDQSIFDKVLPSTVADEEVLSAMYSQEKISILENGNNGFTVAKIERNNAGDKIKKVTWEFKKNEFGDGASEKYKKLELLPNPLLKLLYSIQNIIIISLSG